MIKFEIMSRVQPIGTRKGQTVYYAQPKSSQKMTYKSLVEHIVRETSLSAGDVSNALISLSTVVCDALQQGMSVDLAELGSIRLVVSSRMMNSPEEVTVAGALNTPRIQFTLKQSMREAAKAVELSIDRSRVTAASTKKPVTSDEAEQASGGSTPSGGDSSTSTGGDSSTSSGGGSGSSGSDDSGDGSLE
ncbi:MAG: HU family DNA-binding protein [Bacteroidaceae bacterium]